ncbi:MAG: glycosyltransferase [Paludibacteraceae bacterium]|nr:glycosyltransferase [Paludibacteraceae bacterium]
MLKLSIIIPMYNVASYVKKCIESVLQQDLSHEQYEMIVVNDGSTDNGLEVLEEMLRTDNRLQELHSLGHWTVVTQENQGLSGARNTGIPLAKGKYIQFIDSDDFLQPNVLGKLLERMERDDLDVLRYNYQNVNEQYEVFLPCKNPKQFVSYSEKVCDGRTFLEERLGYACYAWQFVLKATLLQDRKDYFTPGILFEDTDWTPRILLKATRVASTPKIVVNYLIRVGSITLSVTKEKKEKILRDKLSLIKKLYRWGKETHLKWHATMISRVVLSLVNDQTYSYEEKMLIVEVLKSEGLFPLTMRELAWQKQLRILLFNLIPSLYCKYL